MLQVSDNRLSTLPELPGKLRNLLALDKSIDLMSPKVAAKLVLRQSQRQPDRITFRGLR